MTNIDYSLEERREAKYMENWIVDELLLQIDQGIVSVGTYAKHPGKLISARQLNELLMINTENSENLSCKVTWQEDP